MVSVHRLLSLAIDLIGLRPSQNQGGRLMLEHSSHEGGNQAVVEITPLEAYEA
jgi:hypothetical protein